VTNLLIGAGLVVSLLLLAGQIRQGEGPGRLWAQAWFACAALTFISIALAREVSGPLAFAFALIGSTAIPALYPLQYLHVRAATAAPARVVWPHALAPLANIILVLALVVFYPIDSSTGVVTSQASVGPWVDALTLVAALVLGFYPLAAIQRLLTARRAIAFRSGVRTSRRLNWLLAWCAASFTLLCIAVVSDLGAIFSNINANTVVVLAVGGLALQVVLVGVYVAGNSRAFEPLPEASLEGAESDLETLSTFMRDQKPYLESGLSARQLADRLGWPTARLVPAVRAAQAAHFNDYLNRWRVEAVMQLVRDRPDAALLDLALEAGFGSKSTFNDAFRRHTGQSPSEFRRRAQPRQQ